MNLPFHISALLLATLLPSLGAESDSTEDLKSHLEPILADYCFDCHDDASMKADLDLESLPFTPTDPANFAIWQRVFDRVHEHEMPPKKKDQPDDEERADLLRYLKTDLLAADQAEVETKGRVRGRRLTRIEYEHTLHDLLGINIPLANKLPADESELGFDTVAEAQQLSHFHLDKYLDTADLALEEALTRVMRGDRSYKRTFGPKALTSQKEAGNYRGPELRNGKVITWPMRLKFAGRMARTRVPASGWYRITIKNLHAINPGPDGTVWGSLRSGSGLSNEPLLYYIASVEGVAKAKNHTYDAWIEEGHLLEFKPNEGNAKTAASGGKGGNISYRGLDHEKDGIAGLSFEGITMERIYPGGPRWELRAHLVPGVKFADGKPVLDAPVKELNRLMGVFAEKAFRRPLTTAQVEPYRRLASETFEQTGSFPESLRAGYRAILCSPRFLTFVEAPGKLDDHALASRLSYLFWSSLPDQRLRALADRGELSKPEVLAQQVERLLNDPKSDRFINNFTDQWLNLKEIDFTTPDPRRFRTFDPVVQDSMVQETRAFIRELIRENLSVRNFVRSDFAMLDTRLKSHYGLKNTPVVPGEGLQKVPVGPKERSGLVTQAAILKVTADGSVTSPVLRGVWVGERILGLHIPPPPPNIGSVEPDIRGAVSIRDQLDKHRSQTSCASCHVKIDPPGFALESFDPIGQWRTKYGNNANSAKVDPTGVTPEGLEFSNIHGWKNIYYDQPDVLARAFARHLLTYATGASIRFSDREAIAGIVAQAQDKNYGLRTLIHATVTSEPFLIK